MSNLKHRPLTVVGWALTLSIAAGCSGSLSAVRETGGGGSGAGAPMGMGGGGKGTGGPVGTGGGETGGKGEGAGGLAGAGGVGAGGAGGAGAGACAECPILVCEPGSTPLTNPGQCCPSSCLSLSSGDAGGGVGVPPSLCEIDLQKFENNGYRTCVTNDNAEIAGVCGPEFDEEYGLTEVCGNFRLHAYGHDGRIGCAYDSSTGDLVGGFLYGLPVQGTFCFSYFAGPAELASCPVPNIPFCDQVPDAGSAGGGAGQGGAAGAP